MLALVRYIVMEKFLSRFSELEALPSRKRVLEIICLISVFILCFSQIRCTLSGHEMPWELGVVKQYVEGKRFIKLRERATFDFKKFVPLIVPSVKKR